MGSRDVFPESVEGIMGGGNRREFDEFCFDVDAVLWVGWGVRIGDSEGRVRY